MIIDKEIFIKKLKELDWGMLTNEGLAEDIDVERFLLICERASQPAHPADPKQRCSICHAWEECGHSRCPKCGFAFRAAD